MLQAFKAGYRHVSGNVALGGLDRVRKQPEPSRRSTLPEFIATKGHAPMLSKSPGFLAARFSSPQKFLRGHWDTKKRKNRSILPSCRRDWITLTCKFFFQLFLLGLFIVRGICYSNDILQVLDPCSLRRERGANRSLASSGRSPARGQNPLARCLQLRSPSSQRAGDLHPGAREKAWRGQRRSDQRRSVGVASLASPSGYRRMVSETRHHPPGILSPCAR